MWLSMIIVGMEVSLETLTGRQRRTIHAIERETPSSPCEIGKASLGRDDKYRQHKVLKLIVRALQDAKSSTGR